ncbi:MAG: hypothetical protein EXR99_14970 [Gemmataceae bacterium]|nr:hypothetical protein [Gemmataceae bacterium]
MEPTVSIIPCPPKDEWEQFFKNAIPDWNRVRFMALHLDACPRCKGMIAQRETALLPGNTPTLEHLSASETSESATSQAATDQKNFPKAQIPSHEIQAYLEPTSEPGCLGKLGGYLVQRVLGEGGMALVLEGEDPALKRKVAIKVLRPQVCGQEKNRLRFLQEARAAAAIDHENVIAIYQVGEQNNFPFIAMQFLRGETLAARLVRGQVPLEESLRIALQTTRGLAAAHDQGLIHRDIKPDNLWLESDGKRGPWQKVKVLDFGLAKAAENNDLNITTQGIILGTPYFMSPEQASGMPLTVKTDIFSLGSVVYLMLAGHYPFTGETTIAVLTSIANTKPKEIALAHPAIPKAFSALAHRMLEKKPQNRPKDCHEIIEELQRIQASFGFGLTGSISLPPAPANWKKRLTFTAAGAALLSLVLFFTFFNTLFPKDPIPVGILHDLSGTMRESGESVKEATHFAIEEINAQGGILGRRLKAIDRDGKSQPEEYPKLVRELIEDEKVKVIFGCWTSASRKTLRPKLEELEGLLLYPVQNEGMEKSENIFYLGPCPNQQILPAVDYAVNVLKKTRFLHVGSDYVFPVAANEIIQGHVAAMKKDLGLSVEILGKPLFIPLGETQMDHLVDRIVQDKPDLILNTINGDSNTSFFRVLRGNREWDNISTISFSVGKEEIRNLNAATLINDYSASSYFQSWDNPKNQKLIKAYAKKNNRKEVDVVLTDPMMTAYYSVHMWANAVREAGTADSKVVREKLKNQTMDGPAGMITLHKENNRAYRSFLLGKMKADDSFDIVNKDNIKLIPPEPYPPYKSPEGWDKFLDNLFQRWDKHWAPQQPGMGSDQ